MPFPPWLSDPGWQTYMRTLLITALPHPLLSGGVKADSEDGRRDTPGLGRTTSSRISRELLQQLFQKGSEKQNSDGISASAISRRQYGKPVQELS